MHDSAIRVWNYPDLDWRFLSGDKHTVPVGYGSDGEPKVVMDILLFDRMTANESIAYCKERVHWATDGRQWNVFAQIYTIGIVPLLRATALQPVAA